MTAYWRSLYPKFSHDPNSKLLASSQGIAKAKEFEERFEYPLVARKVDLTPLKWTPASNKPAFARAH